MTKPKARTKEPIIAPVWMIIDAVRYAMGRRSYQVGITTEWLISNWNALDDPIKAIIQRDIEKEFERAEITKDYSDFGFYCDRANWEAAREFWRGGVVGER